MRVFDVKLRKGDKCAECNVNLFCVKAEVVKFYLHILCMCKSCGVSTNFRRKFIDRGRRIDRRGSKIKELIENAKKET